MQKVLRQVALIEARLLNHLALRNGILVHVFLDGLCNHSLVSADWEEGGGGGGGGRKKEGKISYVVYNDFAALNTQQVQSV